VFAESGGTVTESEDLSRLRHDLRAPLAVAIGFAELLASERPLSEAQRREYAERVLAAAVELRSKIDELD
jgi:signal transduction histidine kinase